MRAGSIIADVEIKVDESFDGDLEATLQVGDFDAVRITELISCTLPAFFSGCPEGPQQPIRSPQSWAEGEAQVQLADASVLCQAKGCQYA